MLLELRIENLLLIERAELRPGRRPRGDHGRDGRRQDGSRPRARPPHGRQAARRHRAAGRARGVRGGGFRADRGAARGPRAGRAARAHRARTSTRSSWRAASARTAARARSCRGAPPSVADLRALGGRLIAFFGQHEHRRLTLASAQLELLDGFGGAGHRELRDGLAAAHRRVRELERRGWRSCGSARARRDRELDLLRFELEEIEAVGPERERGGRPPGASASGCGASTRSWPPPAGAPRRSRPRAASPAWAALLAEAERLAGAVAGVDPALDELAARLATLRIEADDLGGGAARLRLDPRGRARAPRGGGGAARALRPAAAQARRQRRRGAGARRALPREARRARVRGGRARAHRGRARRGACRSATGSPASSPPRDARPAPRLAERVRAELETLALEGAEFEVVLEPRDEIGRQRRRARGAAAGAEPRRAGRARCARPPRAASCRG